jgi:predicted MPP superfamily phosphohydrolase
MSDNEEIKTEISENENSELNNTEPENTETENSEVKEETSAAENAADDGEDAEIPHGKRSKKDKKKNKKEKKPKKKHGKVWLCIFVVLILLIGWGSISVIKQNNELEKSFYQVKSSKVLSNIRIVCISDMHLKEFGENNKDLVKEIKNLSPDIIAIPGDMNLESEPDNYGAVMRLCEQLKDVAPLYYSLGNHEIDAILFKNSQIYNDLKNAGINILNNETREITIDGTTIDIIGLTQNPKEYDEYGREFFEKAMNADDDFKLVLTHYPENFMGVLEDYDIDLALAGSAHGGQVRLPWIGGLYSADQGVLPKLCDGYHEIGNSKLIVTRGLGKSGVVPRINNKPEIAVIDIGWY